MRLRIFTIDSICIHVLMVWAMTIFMIKKYLRKQILDVKCMFRGPYYMIKLSS